MVVREMEGVCSGVCPGGGGHVHGVVAEGVDGVDGQGHTVYVWVVVVAGVPLVGVSEGRMAARVVLRDDGGLGSGGVGSHSTRLGVSRLVVEGGVVQGLGTHAVQGGHVAHPR